MTLAERAEKLKLIENNPDYTVFLSQPSEEGIMQIIELVKSVEKYLNCFEENLTSIKSAEYKYTKGCCYNLAQLIKIAYKSSPEINIINLSASQSKFKHWAIKFKDDYFDINGKKTKEEITEWYCNHINADSTAVTPEIKKDKSIINRDLGFFDDVQVFCLEHIKPQSFLKEQNVETQ